jgi:very-short-patch-repair endonuclease
VPRKHNKALTPRAKALRKNMTPQERKLWYEFLQNYPVRVLRQKVILSYIVDFYCSKAKLVIEVDGGQHFQEENMAFDEERTKVIEGFDLEVMRFNNHQVDHEFDAVCSAIDVKIQERIGKTEKEK